MGAAYNINKQQLRPGARTGRYPCVIPSVVLSETTRPRPQTNQFLEIATEKQTAETSSEADTSVFGLETDRCRNVGLQIEFQTKTKALSIVVEGKVPSCEYD